MEYIPAKTIVTRTKSSGQWFGIDYNMNIYKGCCHGCIYCDSRSECYRIGDFDRVRAKEDALRIIRDELRRKVKTGVVGTGAMSDPYNPFEKKLEHTLSQIEGAGEAKVVLTLDGGSRQVLARNQDRDGEGGGSNTVVTVGKGSGQQDVVPLQTVAPEFRGALVVCPGGGNAQVRLKLIEAVSAPTGLGSDRISVCQGGT